MPLLILLPRGRAPFGQYQELRPLYNLWTISLPEPSLPLSGGMVFRLFFWTRVAKALATRLPLGKSNLPSIRRVFVSYFQPIRLSDHSRPQRPRSFWSAPRITTSVQVQRHLGFEWVCKHNRLRPEPIRLVRLDSEHAQSDRKSVNRGLPVLDLARGQGQRSWFLVLTKRSAASGNENDGQTWIWTCAEWWEVRESWTSGVEPSWRFWKLWRSRLLVLTKRSAASGDDNGFCFVYLKYGGQVGFYLEALLLLSSKVLHNVLLLGYECQSTHWRLV